MKAPALMTDEEVATWLVETGFPIAAEAAHRLRHRPPPFMGGIMQPEKTPIPLVEFSGAPPEPPMAADVPATPAQKKQKKS